MEGDVVQVPRRALTLFIQVRFENELAKGVSRYEESDKDVIL